MPIPARVLLKNWLYQTSLVSAYILLTGIFKIWENEMFLKRIPD